MQATAVVFSADGGPLSGRTVTWESGDPDVASISGRCTKQGGSGGIGLKPDPRSVLQGPPASFNESAAMAARTRSGLAGSVSIQTPQASWIAAVIAGTTGIITISPIPRAPNGEIGSGDSMITDSISGTASTAVGTPLPSKP